VRSAAYHVLRSGSGNGAKPPFACVIAMPCAAHFVCDRATAAAIFCRIASDAYASSYTSKFAFTYCGWHCTQWKHSRLFSQTSFQFAFSVREVVAQGRYMWADDDRGVDDALAAFDLRDLADRPVTRLSGGERQRVGLARAVATGAGLQLWDEPVAQLDVRHALEVLALARRLANGGAALLVSLHDLRMAHSFDRVLLLQRGRLVADGRPEEVLTPAAILEVFGVRARSDVSLQLELPDVRP